MLFLGPMLVTPPNPARPRAIIGWLTLLSFLVVALVACGTEDYMGDPIKTAVDPGCATGKTRPRIVGGYADTSCDETPAVVRIEDPVLHTVCTGTLIRDDLVLTAGHCVADVSSPSPTCNEVPPVWLKKSRSEFVVIVERGTEKAGDYRSMTFVAKEVKRPDDDTLCGGDIAVIALEEKVPADLAEPLPMRLDRPVQVGDKVQVIGFGLREQGATGRRDRTDAIPVERVGPSKGACGRPTLAAHEFETSRSFCQGDSGGPAIDVASGAIVGVVSRNIDCSRSVGFVYTEIAGHRTFLERALNDGAAPKIEPTVVRSTSSASAEMSLVFGSECQTSDDCDSGYCVIEKARSYCSRTCDKRGYKPCPAGWECTVQESKVSLCTPKPSGGGGDDDDDDDGNGDGDGDGEVDNDRSSANEETVERRVLAPQRSARPPLPRTGGGCSPPTPEGGSCEADGALIAAALGALRRRRGVRSARERAGIDAPHS